MRYLTYPTGDSAKERTWFIDTSGRSYAFGRWNKFVVGVARIHGWVVLNFFVTAVRVD